MKTHVVVDGEEDVLEVLVRELKTLAAKIEKDFELVIRALDKINN